MNDNGLCKFQSPYYTHFELSSVYVEVIVQTRYFRTLIIYVLYSEQQFTSNGIL
jgi:hypothetical protein